MTDLEAIKARAEAATPGPWRVKPDHGGYDFHGFPTQTSIVTEEWPGGGWSRYGFNPTDAEFIAHARTDVPALVVKVEELRAIVRSFAAGPWIYDNYVCFQCKSLANADGTMDEPHAEDCPYAAAVRWVEANPG